MGDIEDVREDELKLGIISIKIALGTIRMLQEIYFLPENAPVSELKQALIEMYRVMTDDI